MNWIDYGKSWNEFSREGLSIPGVVISVGGKELLIGDINANAGVCDDCTEFSGDTIVDRYQPSERKK